MLKKWFMKHSLRLIKEYYPNYNKTKLERLSYGLEGVYLTITKLLIIFFIAYILGILGEVLILTILFNIIRLPAFGVHAPKSWLCLFLSTLFLLGAPLILKYTIFSFTAKLVICLICFILFVLYAPADTKKRPIISKNKRHKLKIVSIILVIIFSYFALNNNYFIISNLVIAALIMEALIILPITYRLLNQSYNNYKQYQTN